MTAGLRSLLTLSWLAISSLPLAFGQEGIANLTEVRGRILAIAAGGASNQHGGLFVADVAGRVYFHASTAPNRKFVDIRELNPKFPFLEARGMAFADPYLYVYDGRSREIWAINVRDEEKPRPQRFKFTFERPSHLAVSSHGLVAVMDGTRLVFLQEGMDSAVYERRAFTETAGLVFSAWDTLRVLDGARGSLVTIKLSRLKDGEIRILSETESAARPAGNKRWQALEVYNGIVFLATDSGVFAYLDAEETLIPVLPDRAKFSAISQLAISADGIYLLRRGGLEWVPRSEPIDMALEGGVGTAQQALVAFYRYLLSFDMLPTRQVRARIGYDRPEDFLLEEGVLLAAAMDDPQPEIRVYQEPERKWTRQTDTSRRFKGPTASQEIRGLICEIDPGFCRNSSAGPKQGEILTIPNILIKRKLSRKTILLQGEPLALYLDHLVFSEEFDYAKKPAFLLRLNPSLHAVGLEKIREVRSGSVAVPVEQWILTAAVPAVEYENRESRLWEFERRFEGVVVYSRRGLADQSAQSAMFPPQDDLPGTACETLQSKKKQWLSSIGGALDKTGRLIWPAVLEKPVRIGVLENPTTLQKTHQVFLLDPSLPTWHTASDLELHPSAVPATSDTGDQVVVDAATFSKEAHHGTHVSALIAGRQGKCWSGLLPRARLVLVDVGADVGAQKRSIATAVDAETLVFNVSQTWEGAQDTVHQTLKGERQALWVVAAGNSGKDLNGADEASVPAPARWGYLSNVVTVTASDWEGNILDDVQTPTGLLKGANRGKRYVDLVAPGKDVYSALEQNRYGPATGTSQAAPHVAAAAALLVDRLGARLTPGDAKARLIATADWVPTYKDKVWGGRLNFAAAAAFPERNLLRTRTGSAHNLLYSFEPRNDPKIVITNAPEYYERHSKGQLTREKLAFSWILSLRRDEETGKYRVVFREPSTGHLKILLDADLKDEDPIIGGSKRIQCSSFHVFDESEREFKPNNACEDGLSITQVDEYFQGGAYRIQWEDQ